MVFMQTFFKMLCFFSSIAFIKLILEKLWSFIFAYPNRAHFIDGTELSSFKFIQIVAKRIGTLNELWLVSFDRELHLDNYFLFVKHIDQDILGAFLQSIFYSHYLQVFRVVSWCFLDVTIKSFDLIFFGWTFTSEKIPNFKCYQGWDLISNIAFLSICIYFNKLLKIVICPVS